MKGDDFKKAMRTWEACQNVQKAMQAEEGRHHATMKGLNSKLAKLQKECTHEATQHHVDPAGGTDSFDHCEICGKNI